MTKLSELEKEVKENAEKNQKKIDKFTREVIGDPTKIKRKRPKNKTEERILNSFGTRK